MDAGNDTNASWELRAQLDPLADHHLTPHTQTLGLYLRFRTRDGFPGRAHACSGVGFATKQRPVVLTLSCRAPAGCPYYVGQVSKDIERVDLQLSDGQHVDAHLIRTGLPIDLWVGTTDGSSVPVMVRAYDGLRRVGELALEELWPENGTYNWGPFYEEPSDR